MSLFYGYSRPGLKTQVTKKQLNDKLKAYTKAPDYKLIFNLNVTKASGNAFTRNNAYVVAITDGGGGVNSSLFTNKPASSDPRLDTTGNHHFLYPNLGGEAFIYAVVPRFMFADVSVFVVVKRNSVRPASGTWEVIVSNDDGDYDKTLGYKAGVNDKLVFGGSSSAGPNECVIPEKFIGRKTLISSHWLAGHDRSHIRINGEKLLDSYFTCNSSQIGKPYLGLFALNDRERWYSDINFYGMKIVEGSLGDDRIEKICNETMAEYDL